MSARSPNRAQRPLLAPQRDLGMAGGVVGRGLGWAERRLGHECEEAWVSVIYQAQRNLFMTFACLLTTPPSQHTVSIPQAERGGPKAL